MTRVTRGLSLAEVLIALVVISLAVLATLSSQAFGLRALSVDPVRARASEVTNRALIAAEISLQDDFLASVARGPEPDSEQADFQVEVLEALEFPTDADDEEPPILKRVTVITTWSGKRGEESFELWTVFIDDSALAE